MQKNKKGRIQIMGKYIRIFIVTVLVLGIAIVGRNKAAWAASLVSGADPTASVSLSNGDPCDTDKDKCNDKDDKDKGGSVKPPPAIVIPVTGGGSYSVGGICTIIIEYKVPGLSDLIYLEVPVEKSRSVPFPESDGNIHLPGCHVLHYQSEQIMNEMSTEDGSWTICFAARPNKTMTIYYYLDNLETVVPTWIPIETTVVNGIVCAPAYYSGVYAPASK
jgi:hypothetical protein